MNVITKVMALLLTCGGIAADAFGADNYWTLNSTEQANWVSANWSLGEKPSNANPGVIPQSAGTANAWKNANILLNTVEEPGIFTLGKYSYSSNRLEIAEGGVISNHHFSACAAANIYSELVFNGGVMTNKNESSAVYLAVVADLNSFFKVIMNSGEWYLGRTHIGYRAPASVELNGGSIILPNVNNYDGLNLGEDSSAIGARTDWKQTGGLLKVGQFKLVNGNATMSGGTAECPVGYLVGSSSPFYGTGGTITGGGLTFNGNALCENMTLNCSGMLLGSATETGSVAPANQREHTFRSCSTTVLNNLSAYGTTLTVTGESFTVGNILQFRSYVKDDTMMTTTLHVAEGNVSIGSPRFNEGGTASGLLGPCVIRQTGGSLDGTSQLSWGDTKNPDTFHLFEISDGTCSINGIGPNSSAATNGMVFRVTGGKPVLNVAFFITNADALPAYFDGVIADGELAMVNQSNSYMANWYFMCAIRPQGGFQLTTNTVFNQLRRYPQSGAEYAIYKDRCRWPQGLFTTNGTDTASSNGSTTAAKWAFDPAANVNVTMTLTADGYTSDAGMPWGWYDLPSVNTNTLRAALVNLTLEPKKKTFSRLQADLEAAGYTIREADAGTGRISLALPLGRLGQRETNRRVFFDFTEYTTPRDIADGVCTTNALVKSFAFVTSNPGLAILLK